MSDGLFQLEEVTIDEALDIFIAAKEAEGVRPQTVNDYRVHIRYLKQFIGNEMFYIRELTAEQIREYINYLRRDRRAFEGDETRVKVVKGLSVKELIVVRLAEKSGRL
ncbi:phage integrase N-terminal SAM-like domain-containing protein [Bacillus spongiae]|uniref:Phage integrase N-terminal SAM-like domain-containing protein n=1 Tax=Bacillus spongiae TaxID=2683610 RepID=A0ABU8H8V4_9BACI